MSMNNLINKAIRKISRIKYTITESGCYIPTELRLNNKRRIGIKFDGRQMSLARLVAFAYHNLDILNTNELACHIRDCPNSSCFNKDHIYKGTYSSNSKDAVAIKIHKESRKTHCPRGHVLNGEIRRRDGRRERYCLTCNKERCRLRRQK